MRDVTRWSWFQLAKYLYTADTDVWTGLTNVNYCDKFTGLKEEIIRATMGTSYIRKLLTRIREDKLDFNNG